MTNEQAYARMTEVLPPEIRKVCPDGLQPRTGRLSEPMLLPLTWRGWRSARQAIAFLRIWHATRTKPKAPPYGWQLWLPAAGCFCLLPPDGCRLTASTLAWPCKKGAWPS